MKFLFTMIQAMLQLLSLLAVFRTINLCSLHQWWN